MRFMCSTGASRNLVGRELLFALRSPCLLPESKKLTLGLSNLDVWLPNSFLWERTWRLSVLLFCRKHDDRELNTSLELSRLTKGKGSEATPRSRL